MHVKLRLGGTDSYPLLGLHNLGRRNYLHLVRTEEAEVAKLQCSTERPDEQPPESPQLEAGRKAAPTKAVAPSAARSGSPNKPGKVHARILLLGGFDQNTQPHHDQSDCRTEI